MELMHRRELLPLLGIGLNAERTFRRAGSNQLPVGMNFDSGEITLVRELPSRLPPTARVYILALTTTVRAFRANAATLLDLPEGGVHYLADAFESHRAPIGRALHLVERATVETNLAIWRAFAPEMLGQAPVHTQELALVHRARPHDLKTLVLLHRVLATERATLYEAPTEQNAITRSDGRLLTELEVWKTLFPVGAEIFSLEHRPSSPP